jgi:hypothetical protein
MFDLVMYFFPIDMELLTGVDMVVQMFPGLGNAQLPF